MNQRRFEEQRRGPWTERDDEQYTSGGGFRGNRQSEGDYEREGRYGGSREQMSQMGREQYGREQYGSERFGRSTGGQQGSGRYEDENSPWGRGFDRERGGQRFGQGGGYEQQGGYGQGGYGQRGEYGQGQGGFGRGGYEQRFEGGGFDQGRYQERGSYGQGGQGSYGQSGGGQGSHGQGSYGQSGYGQGGFGSMGMGRDQESSWQERSFSRGGSQQRFGQAPRGYKRSDERIREDVCDALMRRPDLDASDCEVQVKDGEVTLQGTVQRRDAKFSIEQLCEQIPGVKDVTNNLRIKQEQRSGSSSQQNGQDEQRSTSGASRSGQNSPNASRA